MPRARYVPAKQNGRHLLDEAGYKYRIMKARPQKTYYECVHKKTYQCPASAVVQNEMDIIIVQSGRNLGRVQKHVDLKNIVSTYGRTPLKVYMESVLAFYNK